MDFIELIRLGITSLQLSFKKQFGVGWNEKEYLEKNKNN